MKMPKSCMVPKCKTGSKSCRVRRSVFKAPTDEAKRKEWAALIPGIIDLKQTQFVCERHFRADRIIRKYVQYDDDGKLIAEARLQRPYLATDARPTIFIAEDDESNLATEAGQLAIPEQNDLEKQNELDFIKVDPDATSEDTIGLCHNNLSTNSLDDEAPCLDDFKVASMNTYGIGSQSKTSSERCLVTEPPIKKLQVISTGCVGDGKNLISLPETWSVTKSIAKIGTEITFCHITTSTQNDIKSLIVNKFFVIENWTGRIQFYVHGKKLCTDNTPLPNTLQNASLLREILATFNRMHICRGLGSVDPSLIENDAFQDQSNSWHDNQCALLTKTRICDSCKTLRANIRRKKRQAVNQRKRKKVSSIPNSHEEFELEQGD